MSLTPFETHRQDPEVQSIPGDWEALADYGRRLSEENDVNRWKLGDLTERVAQGYGDQSLAEYASDIRIFYKTLLIYRTVSNFYPQSTRIDFPSLSWSHYRMCVRLGDLDSALKMLADAADNNWSARDLTDALNVALGRPPVKRPLLESEVVAGDQGIAISDAALAPGDRYLVKVYQL